MIRMRVCDDPRIHMIAVSLQQLTDGRLILLPAPVYDYQVPCRIGDGVKHGLEAIAGTRVLCYRPLFLCGIFLRLRRSSAQIKGSSCGAAQNQKQRQLQHRQFFPAVSARQPVFFVVHLSSLLSLFQPARLVPMVLLCSVYRLSLQYTGCAFYSLLADAA